MDQGSPSGLVSDIKDGSVDPVRTPNRLSRGLSLVIRASDTGPMSDEWPDFIPIIIFLVKKVPVRCPFSFGAPLSGLAPLAALRDYKMSPPLPSPAQNFNYFLLLSLPSSLAPCLARSAAPRPGSCDRARPPPPQPLHHTVAVQVGRYCQVGEKINRERRRLFLHGALYARRSLRRKDSYAGWRSF